MQGGWYSPQVVMLGSEQTTVDVARPPKMAAMRVCVCLPQHQLNATEAMWATQASKRERIESLTTRTSQVKMHERQTCDGAVQVVLGETVWEQRHRVGHRRVKVGPQSSCYLRLCDEYAV
jgi:hypothetical protein